MPYLDAVLKENLRMFPSVPSISRQLTEDIEVDGYKLYEGTQVLVPIYAIHHDPDIYKDPFKFNPDRWLNKEVPIEDEPYCFIPFSGKCIYSTFEDFDKSLRLVF